MVECPICHRQVDSLSTLVRNNQYLSERCERCVGNLGSAQFSREYDRRYQRREYAKDIVQPWEKEEFIKAYPKQARQYGYTDEDFRKYG